MDLTNVERTWWFRSGVGALTLLSAIVLFEFAGFGIHSVFTALIAFLCLLGLERLYSGLLGLLLLLVRARRRT
jgi:hypothetical protein